MFSASWIRQPTTMIGLALISAAISLALFGFLPVSAMLVLLISGMGLAGFDDNTALTSDVKTFATDAVTSAVQGHLTANLPKLVQDAMTTAMDAAKKGVAVVLLLIVVAFGVSACSPQQLATACMVDQTAQPIGADTLSALVPNASDAVAIDKLLVHPAIVKYCDDQGGKPVAVPAVPVVDPNVASTPPPQPASAGIGIVAPTAAPAAR